MVVRQEATQPNPHQYGREQTAANEQFCPDNIHATYTGQGIRDM